MGTIREKLASLSTTKNAIRQAIVNKGIDMASTDTFRSYAEKIGLISQDTLQERSVAFGPYMDPAGRYYTKNTEIGLPTQIQDTLKEFPGYTLDEGWIDIEKILDEDTENYPSKMIILYPGTDVSINLKGANFYRTSDGTTYAAESLTAAKEHTWDRSFDKIDEVSQERYRYVIYYFSDSEANIADCVQNNALVIITDSIRWKKDCSYMLSRKYLLQYFKSKNSDWSLCENLERAFEYCRNQKCI